MILKIGKHAATFILAAVIVGVLLLGAFAARLAMGPIPMTWAVPYFEQAIHGEGGIPAALGVNNMALAWDPDTHHIEFTAHHVTVTQQASGLTSVDQIGVTFSVLALLRGELRLKDIALSAPHFHFVLPENNAADGAGNAPLVSGAHSFLQHLHSVNISGGTVDIEHGGSNVHDMIEHVGLSWKRNLWSSAGTLDAVLRLAENTTPSPLHVDLKEGHHDIQIAGSIKNILPADLQFILNHVAPKALPPSLSLERLQMQTSLNAAITLSPQGALQQLSGSITADSGHVILPEYYSNALPIQGLQMKGEYDAVHGNWQLDNFAATILDSDGAIPVTMKVDGNTTLHNIHADMTMQDLTTAQLKRWWPHGTAPGAIDWLNINLKDGKIPHLSAAVDLHAADGQNYNVARAEAAWDLQNMTTTFLPGFPAITGINGKAVMSDTDNLHFDIQSGHLGNIALQPGTMDISGLSADIQILKMNLPATGQLASVLKLLDTQPYAYIKKMGVDAGTATGGVGVDVKMEFPLLAALKISDIKYHAAANLSEIGLPGALMGKDVSRGQGVLDIDPQHMTITGRADVSGVPMEFTWQDFAAPKDGITRQVQFSSELLDGDHARLGLPTAGRVVGSTKLSGDYEVRSGQGTLHAQMDFQDAAVRVDELSYQKPVGAAMNVTADFMLGDTNAFKLNASAKDLTVSGSGILDANMNPLKLNFPVMKLGAQTDAQLSFEQRGQQQFWTIGGNALDISQFITSQSHAPKNLTPSAAPPRAIQIKVGTLYLANQMSMKNFQGDMDYNGRHWDRVNVRGDLHANAPLNINWDANSAARKLTVRTPDAGAVLAALDITTAMIGGDLTIDGAGNAPGGAPGTSWLAHGRVTVKNFRMREVPFLGRLISAVSPGELLDKLRGKDGVGFDKLEVNFDYNDNVLRLSSGKAHGQAIGLTFEGDVNHAASPTTVKMNGTFVPLYMVNGVLSGVPIIGDIINGKSGGGLLGFNYTATGPANDPSVSVNPLSVFAPGFLRDLFF